MVFCNLLQLLNNPNVVIVTILILVDGFLQYDSENHNMIFVGFVTILILVDGFLQYGTSAHIYLPKEVTILILVDGFLQY